MISVKSNNINLKYQRFAPSGWKDREIWNFKFVAFVFKDYWILGPNDNEFKLMKPNTSSPGYICIKHFDKILEIETLILLILIVTKHNINSI